MSEIWKAVPGYEGAYEVSDSGRVRSLDRVVTSGHTRRGKILKGSINRNRGGYRLITLSWASTTRTFGVHQLVLWAFIGPTPPGLQVRHVDGDVTNNTLRNLEYGTVSENAYDRVRHGTHPLASKSHCIRGHELKLPNLTGESVRSGQRRCLACNRARSRVKGTSTLSLQEESDRCYAEIQKDMLIY